MVQKVNEWFAALNVFLLIEKHLSTGQDAQKRIRSYYFQRNEFGIRRIEGCPLSGSFPCIQNEFIKMRPTARKLSAWFDAFLQI